ncbi:MAG: hypothetical protein DMH00_12675 [Acidobacteria bacterium]|nr:MAG: hypothetical protein DMH00_12675 [Acidobacteriota bacterium]
MSILLCIGGEQIRIVASPGVIAAVSGRYRPFVTSRTRTSPRRIPIVLEIRCRPGRFRAAYEQPLTIQARETAPGEIRLDGPVAGCYSLTDRQGWLEGAPGLGAVDALLRIALSTALPLDGALLVHGAALRHDRDGGIVLCGASGAGKSTAARALGAFCDELAVLRLTKSGLHFHSTPYWRGEPVQSSCAAVICLARGGEPGFERLRGAAAARVLSRHAVRYVTVDRIDRAVLDLLCAIGERAGVWLASCPEGEAFIPFLKGILRFDKEVA